MTVGEAVCVWTVAIGWVCGNSAFFTQFLLGTKDCSKKKKKVKLMAEEQSDKCLLGVRHLAKFRVALDEARSEQHR